MCIYTETLYHIYTHTQTRTHVFTVKFNVKIQLFGLKLQYISILIIMRYSNRKQLLGKGQHISDIQPDKTDE